MTCNATSARIEARANLATVLLLDGIAQRTNTLSDLEAVNADRARLYVAAGDLQAALDAANAEIERLTALVALFEGSRLRKLTAWLRRPTEQSASA